MVFKASLDNTAKYVTIGVVLLFIGITFGAPFFGMVNPIEIDILLVVVFGVTFLFAPQHYELNPNELIIKRPLNRVIINRLEIKTVQQLEKGKLRWAIRTFGSGGFFGYFGTFWNKEFGNMTWYATKKDNAIMIVTTKNKKIIITPDDKDGFLGEFITQ